MLDYNDYCLAQREKAILRAEEEAEHMHKIEGYVVCRYYVQIEYDDREYNSFDIEELMIDDACKTYDDDIYYHYDEVEILKED